MQGWFFYILIWLLVFLVYASYSIKSQFYVKAICRVKTGKRVVFLTFDDGPDAEQTPKVLDVLKRNNAKATFFCIGNKIAGNEAIMKRIADDGHLIGIHSFCHSGYFPILKRKKMIADLEQCKQAIAEATGQTTTLFRPPFGVTNPIVAKAVKALNLTTIGWTIRTYDTNMPKDEIVLKRIKRNLKRGAIILLHDRLPNSDTLLQKVIDEIRSAGYEIMPLPADAKNYQSINVTAKGTPITN